MLVNEFTSNATPTTSAFKTSVFCPALPSFINCNKVTLNIQAYDPATTSFATVASSIGKSWYNNPAPNVSLGQPGWIVLFQAFYPMPVYLSVLVATGTNGNGVSNLNGQTSNSIYNNPNGSGFVHAIFSTNVSGTSHDRGRPALLAAANAALTGSLRVWGRHVWKTSGACGVASAASSRSNSP